MRVEYNHTGKYYCKTCEHRWEGTHPTGIPLECPMCKKMTGRSVQPINAMKNEQKLRCGVCENDRSFIIIVDHGGVPIVLCRVCGKRSKLIVTIFHEGGNPNVVKPE